MGNLSSCNKCSTADSSVINLSDRLVLKLTQGIEPPREEETETIKQGLQQEYDAMQKLQCIDNSHSAAYGLSVEGFEQQRTQMLDFLSKYKMHTDSRARALLIECLRDNPDCVTKCFREMEEYMDWIDARRMAILKERKDADLSKVKKLWRTILLLLTIKVYQRLLIERK